MGLFVCDYCGCVENTSRGHWWSRNVASIWKDEDLGKARCSLHAPLTFRDGTPNKKAGKWHGGFNRAFPTTEEIERGDYNNPEVARKWADREGVPDDQPEKPSETSSS